MIARRSLPLAASLALGILSAVASDPTSPAIPETHPYLALTPREIAHAKELATRLPWAQASLENLLDEADSITSKPTGALPEKGDKTHWEISSNTFTAAIAFALSGKRHYAEWVRDTLIAYAKIYPALPLSRGRCRVFSQSSLYEAMWLVPITQAYDIIASSDLLTDQQRDLIENDLLRAAVPCLKIDDYEKDPRGSDLHYRCYNFQAWHLSGVGLVGLALHDPQLVDWTINGRYGFKHLVAHDIRDDGLFWERSLGYHKFVIEALLPLTEAMAHCNVDLYNLEIPNDQRQTVGAHYVTDSSTRPKSLRSMFEPLFYAAFPDLTYPALGDSDHGPLRANWTHLIGYHRYSDPRLKWLLQRDVPLTQTDPDRGRVGFLHYYRYSYRYENVQLDGQPVSWERRDPTFQQQNSSILASDGDTSQPDRYLLNNRDLAGFSLEWTMTRLANPGPKDRAWMVFHAPASNLANRKCFSLASYLPEINRPYRFQVEVAGDTARLLRDGEVISTRPTVYRDGPDWHWLIYSPPAPSPHIELPLNPTFANSGRHENNCSLFPSSGLAVLRQAEGDFTRQPDSTAATLSFGPHGGGHGHSDQLNLTVYAQGKQWIPDFGSMPYETHWKAKWTAQTLSHNTLVVDETSQLPTGRNDVEWPVDSPSTPVIGKLELFAPERRFVSASCDRAYSGFQMKRDVQIHDHCVIDQLSVTPTSPAPNRSHRFDYVLHVDGTLTETSRQLSPRNQPLGSRCGYQLAQQTLATPLHETFSLTFASAQKRIRIWVVTPQDSEAELIVASGLTSSPDQRIPMILVRREASCATFLTVVEPVTEQPLRTVQLEQRRLILESASGRKEVPLP